MIILEILFYIVATMCIVYAIFRPKDVLSWWWVKGKLVCINFWDMIRGFLE